LYAVRNLLRVYTQTSLSNRLKELKNCNIAKRKI
jgi:hypothetical protein